MRRTLQAVGIAVVLVTASAADDGDAARAEDAARRAEDAAVRAEQAARRVEDAADRLTRLLQKLERTAPRRTSETEEQP
jgi:hypothetical protein